MKRSMMFVCAALLAFAVGCGKKKDEKKPADDKAPAGETKPVDPAATAGGETKPAEATPPAEGMAPATGELDVAALCKKIEELATKEGGKGLEQYNARLKDDCVKDLGDSATKKGPEATKAFVTCVNAAASFTAAMDTCKQLN